MYRHSAESIKESSRKMFVSLEEKTKYNNYENTLRKKDDSYNKIEVDNKIKELSDNTYGNVESSYISESNTLDGYVKDLEILGNTVQNTEDLADIKSVGELQEDGTYKMSILSCGKNLYNITNLIRRSYITSNTGEVVSVGDDTNPAVTELIKVKPNTSYILSLEYERGSCFFGQYDINNNFISKTSGKTITTTPSTRYIRVQIGLAAADEVQRIQLEESNTSTTYEPYQESRVDISLPCQLEKVGDISDRLYYDEKEKAWCIDKYIVTKTVNGNEGTWNYTDNGEYSKFGNYGICVDGYFNIHSTMPVISDVFITGISPSQESIQEQIMYYCHGDLKTELRISILSSKLPSLDSTGFKSWLNDNNINIKYQLATPQKIILPLSTQIQLNSYADRTHIYTVSGEVEPTIKATLPKSLGSSVQSLNDKTDIMIERIEAVETLKEGQNLSYESDKGHVLCENTNNGQIDNIKIEGKTLVNLYSSYTPYMVTDINNTNNFNSVSRNGYIKINVTNLSTNIYRYINFGKINVDQFEPNTVYTIAFKKIKGVGLINIQDGNTDNYITSYIKAKDNQLVYTFKTKNTITKSNQILYLWINQDLTTLDIEVENPIILKGDHTQNPPSCFEGLMSVGGDNEEINIITNNENLLAKDFVLGALEPNGSVSSSTYRRVSDFIFTPKQNCNIYFKYNQKYNLVWWINEYDKNKINICQTVSKSPILNSETEYIRVGFRKNDSTPFTETELKDLNVAVSYYNTDYIPHKSHKKSLLYYNDLGELVPVPELHEWDSIEKHSDGKYYYHKRSEKLVLDGSEDENWVNSNWNINNPTTRVFDLWLDNVKCLRDTTTNICDKFKYTHVNSVSMNTQYEFITTNGKGFGLNINKARLSEITLTGFKSWLSSNPVTVVYQLKTEEVYECVNLNLDTYDNETLVMVNSGAISPKLSFNVSSHIGNTVSILRERLKAVEEEYINYKLTQDKLLLNTLYSSDRGSYSVSTLSTDYEYQELEEVDYELFEITKSVIEVGLDNYNTTEMEELIDFYTIIGKFDYDMADVLFEIIENQINPPVIEIPEEEIEILPEI